ncbi:hypothetical protein [Nostoc sp.]
MNTKFFSSKRIIYQKSENGKHLGDENNEAKIIFLGVMHSMNLVNNAKVLKVSVTSGNYSHHIVSSGAYTEGTAATPFGFVRVYAEANFWALEFIWKGKSYHFGGRCKGLPSDKALTCRASKFAKEVVKKNLNELI